MSKNKQKSISEKLVFQIKLFFRKYPSLPYILKWTFICSFIGILIGSASAGFLQSLNWATDFRENNLWLIALLPVGGFLIGLLYFYIEKTFFIDVFKLAPPPKTEDPSVKLLVEAIIGSRKCLVRCIR